MTRAIRTSTRVQPIHRMYDHVLADGRYRVAMTQGGIVLVTIEVPETALGPMALGYRVRPRPMTTTGGLVDDDDDPAITAGGFFDGDDPAITAGGFFDGNDEFAITSGGLFDEHDGSEIATGGLFDDDELIATTGGLFGDPDISTITTGGLLDDQDYLISTGGLSDDPDIYAIATGGIFGDIGKAVKNVGKGVGKVAGKAAEGAFNAASKSATTIARPAFNLTRDAAAAGTRLVAQIPVVPERERKKIEAASRVMLKARLGDVTAKEFVRGVAKAANAGVGAARSVGDTLLKGASSVAHVLDAPMRLVGKVPIIGGTMASVSPFLKMEKMSDNIRKGDFEAIKKMVTEDARMAAGVASLIPGIGTGIGAAISAGLAILNGGGPLEIAINAAYGAIPIPPGIRQITDAVLQSVLSIAKKGNVTDAALAAARSQVPPGLPRDVFDTLVQLVVKRVPVKRAAEQLVGHYVDKYAPKVIPKGVTDTVQKAARTVSNAADTVNRVSQQAAAVANTASRVAANPASMVTHKLQLPAAITNPARLLPAAPRG